MGMYNYFPDKEIKSQCQRQGSAYILQYYIYYNSTYFIYIIICKHPHFVSVKNDHMFMLQCIVAPKKCTEYMETHNIFLRRLSLLPYCGITFSMLQIL